MANNSEWWTAPTESENGNLIMVTAYGSETGCMDVPEVE